MFDTPRYTQNTFNVFFGRQLDIRRKSNAFERILADKYLPPLVLPVPDEQEPELPRLVFSSKSGFSQIIISQVSIAISVQYSEDFQSDISKGRAYLAERVPIIFKLASRIGATPLYSGFSTQVKLFSKESDRKIIDYLSRAFLASPIFSNTYDFQLRITDLNSDRFFSNITIANYRTWEGEDFPQRMTRLSTESAVERGVLILSDFNDRYSYNEASGYKTNSSTAKNIIDGGLSEVARIVIRVQEGQK